MVAIATPVAQANDSATSSPISQATALAALTPAQLADLQKVGGYMVDINYFNDKLTRLQRLYARACGRYQLAQELEELSEFSRGAVTVTFSGPTGSLTFDGQDIFAGQDCLITQGLCEEVENIKDEILAFLADSQHQDANLRPDERATLVTKRALHALCMPPVPAA